MFESFWRGIQRRMTRLAVKKAAKRAAQPEISLLGVWEEVRRILICWPGDGMDVLAARVVFNRVRERFPNAALAVLAMPGIGASPPPEVDAEIITVKKESLSMFGVPSRQLSSKLYEAHFDAVVDLSPHFEPLVAYLCLATEAKIRIGFACPDGDLAYNYQVSPRDDRTGIDRYRVMARYIG